MDTPLIIALIALAGWALTLVKHILFKRELYNLKREMKQHTLHHGVDDGLWQLFVERTRTMLRFWR